MKTKHIFALCAAGLFGLSGCVGDLEVQPLDQNLITAEEAYSDPASYTKALMKIYSIWALHSQDGKNGTCDISGIDGGNSQILRSWFNLQEVSTDEAKCIWPNAWCSAINCLAWADEKNEAEEGVYQFGMYIVSLVNEFMKNVGNAPEEMRSQYAAEARFNRALAYYILMDAFGYPPFITENNYSNSPSQVSREELFNFIESELNDIRGSLPEARQGEYGRADQGAVDALLARMYLNAEVYTGKNRYTDCITACKRIIAAGYELADNYANLFKADNGQNSDTRKEIIFPICFDGTLTQTWGGTSYIILASRAITPDDPTCGFTVSGWGGLLATGNLLRQFEYADPQAPTSDNILDKRGIFSSKYTDENGEWVQRSSMDITNLTGVFTAESWAVFKYCNTTSTGEMGPNSINGEDADTDFPFFRLGDVYLMYAEAVARGGQGGDMSTAVDYVNQLRRRGYGDDNHQINAAWLTANATLSDTNASVQYGNILNERSRELYWEAIRRTDLIRFGLFTSGSYVWSFKGGVQQGIGVDDKYNLYAIPTSDLSVNPNLNQNEGF